MTGSMGPQQIKQIVLQTFEKLGAKTGESPGETPNLNETLLLDEGRYLARSYRAGDLMAMWFVESGFIQFYDADGTMLCTVNLRQDGDERRMAA